MDSLKLYDIKAEKANAMRSRQSKLHRIGNFVRFFEALVVLILVSRLSVNIPHSLRNSTGLFRDLYAMFFSSRFVFVLGNVIVVVLFAKSGQFSQKKASLHDNLYDEFLRSSSEKKVKATSAITKSAMTRSKSAVFQTSRAKNASRVLARSETEKFGNLRSCVDDGLQRREIGKLAVVEKKKNCLYPEDLMSGEEFRLKVEAFIARQQRFRSMEDDGFTDYE